MTARQLALLKYAIERYQAAYVDDSDESAVKDVPHASLAQSTAEPWGDDHCGITFVLRDAQARVVAEGRVGLDRANRRHLRWWLDADGDGRNRTIPDLFRALRRGRATYLA